MFSIEGKVALITGGAGAIGFGIAKELLKNGLKGVAIIDVSEEGGRKAVAEITDNFGQNKVIFIRADVANKKELEDAFEATIKTYYQLDIVFNNAGVMNELDWHQTIAVNLVAVIEGTYLAMKKYLPKYKSGEEGIIVNTSSLLGLFTIQSSPVYISTKHALIGFGRTLGGEKYYEKYKVRVLTLCPGLIETPLAVDTLKQDNNMVWFHEVLEKEVMSLSKVFQRPERVGEAAVEIIKKGKTGSVWVTEDEEPEYEIQIPHFRTMKVFKE